METIRFCVSSDGIGILNFVNSSFVIVFIVLPRAVSFSTLNLLSNWYAKYFLLISFLKH